MKPIERIAMYLEYCNITPHAFEKKINLSNGYFSKQLRNQGSVGSDILIKIHEHYPYLNILWVLTGDGEMTDELEAETSVMQVHELTAKYASESQKTKTLETNMENLHFVLKDKEKLIFVYEHLLRKADGVFEGLFSILK